MALSLCRGPSSRPFGLAHNAISFHQDLRLTLLELDRLVEAGFLARVKEEELEMEFRFEAIEDWRDFVSRPHAGELDVDPVQLSHAEACLSRGEGAIIAAEAQVATAFQRMVPRDGK